MSFNKIVLQITVFKVSKKQLLIMSKNETLIYVGDGCVKCKKVESYDSIDFGKNFKISESSLEF